MYRYQQPATATTATRAGALTTDARVALVGLASGRPLAAHMIGGTTLQVGECELALETAGFKVQIAGRRRDACLPAHRHHLPSTSIKQQP